MSMMWSDEDVDVTLNRIEIATLREEQTLAQLNEIGIGFDKPSTWERDYGHRYPKPSEGPSTLIAAMFLGGFGLAGFIVFVNWAVKVITR